MPPLARANAPSRAFAAPVKAPRSWPKNSLPESSGTMVVQSTTTRAPFCGRGSRLWIEPGDQFLAGSALAQEEHGGVGEARHLRRPAQRRSPGRALPDEVVPYQRRRHRARPRFATARAARRSPPPAIRWPRARRARPRRRPPGAARRRLGVARPPEPRSRAPARPHRSARAASPVRPATPDRRRADRRCTDGLGNVTRRRCRRASGRRPLPVLRSSAPREGGPARRPCATPSRRRDGARTLRRGGGARGAEQPLVGPGPPLVASRHPRSSYTQRGRGDLDDGKRRDRTGSKTEPSGARPRAWPPPPQEALHRKSVSGAPGERLTISLAVSGLGVSWCGVRGERRFAPGFG